MPLDRDLLKESEELRVPVMGSEIVAPLLYSLIRFTRPRRVLEVGTGYTTPFIARALADNIADFEHGSRQLVSKTRDFLKALGSHPHGEERKREQEKWVTTEPALASPQFYALPYAPRFLAIDSLTLPTSSASKVCGVLGKLGLHNYVTLIDGDFRSVHDQIGPEFLPIDFAWVDCDQTLDFFDQYWKDINPQDGLVVIHWLLTDKGGETVLEYIKSKCRVNQDLELVSFWEPHKIAQNSLTIIRKITVKNRVFGDKAALLQDTMQFLRSVASR